MLLYCQVMAVFPKHYSYLKAKLLFSYSTEQDFHIHFAGYLCVKKGVFVCLSFHKKMNDNSTVCCICIRSIRKGKLLMHNGFKAVSVKGGIILLLRSNEGLC